MRVLPTVEYLHSALQLDASRGELRWKYRDDMPGNWNTRYFDKIALATDKGDGYLAGTVNGVKVSAHRVIWAMHYGTWPAGEIDHINGKPADNRIANLRLATRSGNCANITGRRRGVRCFKGVYWYAKGAYWTAKILEGDRTKHLGYFHDEADAARAYDKAAILRFGDFARTNAAMGLFTDANRIPVRDAARKRLSVIESVYRMALA